MKFLMLMILFTFSATSMAAAPMVKTQGPGYYRFMLGDFEVTALYDGSLALSANTLLTRITKAKVDSELKKSFLSNPVETSVNAYLINTGEKLILIDAGAATLFGPGLGKLLVNLKASGYDARDVDEIYITHLHNDHIGGLFTNDKVSFPNAIVRADQHDLDFWLSPANLEKAPNEMRGFFEGPVKTLAPYQKANKVKPFEGNAELVKGIKAIETHGHTVGHTVYMIESKGNKMLVIGDLIHVGPVQFGSPDVTIQFDTDNKKAHAQRMKIFNEAAKEGYILAAAHISFPGLGHLRKSGKGFIWLPLNYTSL